MLFIMLCGSVLAGSLLGSALNLALEGYKTHRAAKDIDVVCRMINGSEPFIAERYLRFRSELAGGMQQA